MKKVRNFKDLSLALILVMISLICNILYINTPVSTPGPIGYEAIVLINVIAMLLVFYCIIRFVVKNKERNEYIEILKDTNVTAANDVLNSFPLAMAVFDIDGAVLWFNDEFQNITKNNNLYFAKIGTIFPEIKWMDLLKSSEKINIKLDYNERVYNVFGKIAKSNTGDDKDEIYSVILYFEDITELEETKKLYNDEKADVAIVNIDNYDELFQKMDDSQSLEVISKINGLIMKWGAEGNAVTKRLESDRYILLFEHSYLLEATKDKFSIIEKVRKIGEEIKIPVTISIGVGTGGHIIENENNAKSAMEMVLGRGGDQAAIKDGDQFTFFGGQVKDYEKSTRVKTRAFSVALKDYIINADNVIFMGHKNADYDCFGAALGLQRAVRTLGKKPYIVNDNSGAISNLTKEAMNNPEYEGMFVSPDEVLNYATENSLVVILDTHRAEMLPAPDLLGMVSKIIIIDHHRRSTDFISPVSLTYHEPFASSTCEMVTEILQHVGDVRKISNLESQALYMGILMDTKNFVVKTGVRTFEAASYLKRCGLDTLDIKRLFNIEYEEYISRVEIIKGAKVYNSSAITVCRENYPNIRVISSQAADEMMNIAGVKAAFVIYLQDGAVGISARSYGDVNVQIIMEKLGGGGHAIVAGAQIKDKTLDEAEELLKNAIDEYFKE